MKREPYRIEFTEQADEQVAGLSARKKAALLGGVARQLTREPTVETRNRKRMRPNPLASHRLRIGDLRVYYDVEAAGRVVTRGGDQGPEPRDDRGRGDRAVKAVELAEARGAISDYAKEARKETVVFTRHGRPVAAVVGVEGLDWEDLVVGSDPRFVAMIERSRRLYKPGTGIPLEEMRRRHGVKSKPARRASRKPTPR